MVSAVSATEAHSSGTGELRVGTGAGLCSLRWPMRCHALNRRNRFFDEPFSETDAGVSYDAKKFRINVTGRRRAASRRS